MRYVWGFLVFLFCFSLNLQAEPYRAAKELQQEVFQRQKELKLSPNSNRAKFELSMAYAYTGQILIGWATLKTIPKSYSAQVIEFYEPLKAKNPSEWRYPFKLAFGYYFKEDKERAISEFQRVLEIDPKQVWALGFISLISGEMGRTDEAVKLAEKAISMEPNAAALHFLLAEGYRRQGKSLKAFKHFLMVGRLEAEERLFYGYDAVKD